MDLVIRVPMPKPQQRLCSTCVRIPEHPCSNSVPTAYGGQSIHSQTIITFVDQVCMDTRVRPSIHAQTVIMFVYQVYGYPSIHAQAIMRSILILEDCSCSTCIRLPKRPRWFFGCQIRFYLEDPIAQALCSRSGYLNSSVLQSLPVRGVITDFREENASCCSLQ